MAKPRMPEEQLPVQGPQLSELAQRFMAENPPPAQTGERLEGNEVGSGLEKPVNESQEQAVSPAVQQYVAEHPPDSDPMPIGTQGKIGLNEIKKAYDTLQRYRQGKANLEARIVDDERWYTMHSDSLLRDGNASATDEEQMDGAWLFNSLANKHADFMDNYPEPNVLPRTKDDEHTATQLSSVLSVALEQNQYEQVYNDAVWYKLKHGTSCKMVVWDRDKLNGLGDIDIRHIDLLNLYWEPGITDIQASRNFFHVELIDNEVLEEQYPFLRGKFSTPSIDVAKYVYDDTIDTSEKSAVIDWYYKRNGILHYCKFVNDSVLYATENDAEYASKGLYDHGKYPFVFDTLFPKAHSPAGFGYIEVMKACQRKIDRLDNALLLNAMVGSVPRYFVRTDGSVNEREFADLNKHFIHVDGNMGEDSIRALAPTPMSSIYPTVLANKIAEIKETSGNRDFSQGGTTSGVSAASAIAALQEAGSKLSRDMIQGAYRAFVEECYLCIELMRQFYDVPRQFRISGEDTNDPGMTYGFTSFDNSGLRPQPQGNAFGIDMGERLPIFDIKVSAARKSTYSRTSQNELAKELYKLGLFNPEMADQSLTTLSMMDFDGKDKLVAKVQQLGGLWEQNQMLQEQVAKLGLIAAQQGVAMGDQNAADMGASIAQNAIADRQQQAAQNRAAGSVESSAERLSVNPLGDAVTGNSLSTQARRRAMMASAPGGGNG